MNRPSLSRSIVAHSLANITGLRKSTPATWGPTRIELVASAAAISAGTTASWLPKWSSMWKLT